uniref:4-coumarate--CoA ligase n=1 Tax=Ananas comosus var. bracteatus TaxID=296719 RepID=A0A6V7NN04_ANACO|nr:unnamed protein product [Ananas comosus var. bracteatus]
MLLTVPLFHAYGFAFCLKAAAVGETAVIQTERFDAKRTLKAVARFRLTHLALAPPAVLALVKFREAGCAGAASVGDVSSLAVVTCSGAPIGTDLIRRFLASFPNARLTQGYGLTETTTGVFRFHGEEANQRIGSVGRLVWGCEAKIVNSDTGIALPPGARGELWIRGPLIMQGYIGDERSTSEILNSEGWFKTGDLCYIDDDGFLFILDRSPLQNSSTYFRLTQKSLRLQLFPQLHQWPPKHHHHHHHHSLHRTSTLAAASARRRRPSTVSAPPSPSLHLPSPSPSPPSPSPSSLLPPPLPPALIDAANGDAISYPELLSQIRSLAAALRSTVAVSKGDVAFILSPPRLDVPVLYLALLSLGVAVSPANPVSTSPEISRLVGLSRPSVAFATSSTAHKLPSNLPTILLDSPRFRSFLQISESDPTVEDVEIRQSDSAAILYSSGTTGRVKGVLLTHGNLISVTALLIGPPLSPPPPPATSAGATTTTLLTVPLFHVYGFMCCLKSVAAGETAAIQTERFDAKRTLAIVERFRITHLALAPPAVLALVRIREAEDAAEDVSSLQAAFCGGTPIGTDLIRRFSSVFPNVRLIPGYGLTESSGSAFNSYDPGSSKYMRSVGRLVWSFEAKIVDPVTGLALPPGVQGELWIRSPTVMQGYIGDEESTSAILNSEGWLRTGDLCYINDEGFLFIIDRLKELIKYKGYQVPPAELEQLLQTHPDIIDAAVIPYPDEEAGQVPVAFVVRKPHSVLGRGRSCNS